ncbi:Gluconate transport-inducing protein [Coemansia sp. RSA 2703]|nr:Gluconate transport-inducing protein [Coemansia sp. RSA 2703]KAJ2366715.1 Gluconate transport-inducing protein [Coemansia sp. RSA 2607]KAJ2394548.1 Gluconate transport-inducing protein [Coemansia sp. RSA 2603]
MTVSTYTGYIDTTEDALLVFEACRLNILSRRTRRLAESERKYVESGSVFVWDETESGIRRWTDGRRWSPSRVSGCFLVYSELESKISSLITDVPLENGLIKKSLSLYTTENDKLHLVCYYRKSDLSKLQTPSNDPTLCHIQVSRSLYPAVIPSMLQTLPVRQTQTMSGSSSGNRRSSITLATLPVNIRQAISMQQVQRRLTLGNDVSATGIGPMDYSDQPLIHSVSSACLPSDPQLSTTSAAASRRGSLRAVADSKSDLRTLTLQNVNNQALAASHLSPTDGMDTDDQPLSALSPGKMTSNMQKSATSSFRSLSHPFLLDNSDVRPIAGFSTAPGSRRNTIFSADKNHRDSGYHTEQFKLPPISELITIADRQPHSLASATTSLHQGGDTRSEKARIRYSDQPWNRRAQAATATDGLGLGLSGYSIS